MLYEYEAELSARDTILFNSTQLLHCAHDTDIMRRTTPDVQTTVIQTQQTAQDLRLYVNDGKTRYMAATSVTKITTISKYLSDLGNSFT